MNNTTYFHGHAARAAAHLLDSAFGDRLAMLGDVHARMDSDLHIEHVTIVLPPVDLLVLSTGEEVLLNALLSLNAGGEGFQLSDLSALDDYYHARVVAAIQMARHGYATAVKR